MYNDSQSVFHGALGKEGGAKSIIFFQVLAGGFWDQSYFSNTETIFVSDSVDIFTGVAKAMES